MSYQDYMSPRELLLHRLNMNGGDPSHPLRALIGEAYDALKAETEYAGGLRSSLQEAWMGFAAAYDSVKDGRYDEALLHLGANEARARKTLDKVPQLFPLQRQGADSPASATTDPSADQDNGPPCNNTVETVAALQEATETPSVQSAPATTTDALLDSMARVAGVPCRFCFAHGSATGPCPDCGNPSAALRESLPACKESNGEASPSVAPGAISGLPTNPEKRCGFCGEVMVPGCAHVWFHTSGNPDDPPILMHTGCVTRRAAGESPAVNSENGGTASADDEHGLREIFGDKMPTPGGPDLVEGEPK